MSESVSVNDPFNVVQELEPEGEQYLMFQLGEEKYGIDILRVVEIKGLDRITRIPNTPSYVCGVLSLRGTIIPIIDLRLRFGLSCLNYSKTTVIVVLKVGITNQRTVGIIVDEVPDTYFIKAETIKVVPETDASVPVAAEFLNGLVDINGKIIMLLNIEQLLSVEAIG